LKKFHVLHAQQVQAINEMITDEEIIYLVESCSERLESLDLSSCNKIKEKSFRAIAEKCSKTLTSLKLRFSTSIHDVLVEKYISQCVNLKYLNLSKCYYVGLYGLQFIAQRCKKLEVLDLSGSRSFSNFSFLEDLKSLKELNVSWTNFSSSYCKSLPESLQLLNVSGCDQLEQLKVEHLSHLTSLDISYCKCYIDPTSSVEFELQIFRDIHNSEMVGQCLIQFLQKTPHLEYLSLETVSSALESVTSQFLALFTQETEWKSCLKRLEISDSFIALEYMLALLREHCPNATTLVHNGKLFKIASAE